MNRPLSAAQIAAMNKPSEQSIARVTRDYVPQDAVVMHDFTIRTGWRIRVYASPWTEGALIACAERQRKGDHPPETLDSQFPDLAAIKAWVMKLPIDPIPLRRSAA